LILVERSTDIFLQKLFIAIVSIGLDHGGLPRFDPKFPAGITSMLVPLSSSHDNDAFSIKKSEKTLLGAMDLLRRFLLLT
jgi:hypothetical protein